jgi:hypothetical protein
MKYEIGKWYGWTGGDCPVHPLSKVVCKFDDGSESDAPEIAGVENWDYGEIVAFKVVEEYEEPREWWAVVSPNEVIWKVFKSKGYAENNIDPGEKLIKIREVKN